jgi:hypothetical protein
MTAKVFALSISDDQASRRMFKKKCLEIKKYNVGSEYLVECNLNYHFYNSKSVSKYYNHAEAVSTGKVKIAAYNMLHPGSLRSSFKDFKLVANIINNWDLVAGLELLPVLGRDNRVNESIIEFLNGAPKALEELRAKLTKLPELYSDEVLFSEEKEKIEQEIQKIESLKISSKDVYRAPGYIKILRALRKLDKSWSLLLAPKGEAAEASHVHELVGFFFRGTKVKPILNEHCDEYKGKNGGAGIACIPNLRKAFFGEDVTEVFSRRPFLASFKSGTFDFSMITSHIIYGSPDDPEAMKKILNPSFGVDTSSNIGMGVTKQNYARWAESKIILKLIKKLRKFYYEQDIIYAGDMNLEASNSYFPTLMKDFPGEELFITKQTTLSQPRFHNQGEPTKGLSKNFDHFIFNKEMSYECLSSSNRSTAKVYPYYSGMVKRYLDKNYKIRDDKYFEVDEIFEEIKEANEEIKNEYVMLANSKTKMDIAQSAFKKELLKLKKISNNSIVPDYYRLDERVELYKKRVFTDQLTNQYFYRMYLEVLSDHLPISMSCRNKLKDDDE